MKHLLLTAFTVCGLAFTAAAQVSPIMVCDASGNTCTPYNNLDTAYTYAMPGSVIYLPGGVFSLNVNINKKVALIGAGIQADSSAVTGMTVINGNITMGDAADSSRLEGMYISGFVSTTGGNVSGLSIRHCNLSYLNAASGLSNSEIRWTIFRSEASQMNNFGGGSYNTISNCYIFSLSYLNSSTIDQCIGVRYCDYVYFCTFKNNICHTYPNGTSGTPGTNNIFKNNVFVSNCSIYCLGTIQYTNNLQMTVNDIFVSNVFTPTNMRLDNTSAAKTAGENGGEVGVYGGLFPYKAGAIPGNPHIYFKNIAPSTNANGELPVQINVRAEDY